MVHNEIHAIDLAIIAAYLIAMVLIGLVVVKKVKSMDDYYLGGRSFGPLVLMATVCATIIGGSGLMGRAGVAYSSGFKVGSVNISHYSVITNTFSISAC